MPSKFDVVPKRITKLVESNLSKPPFAKTEILTEKLNFKPCAVNYKPKTIKPDPKLPGGNQAVTMQAESPTGGNGNKDRKANLFEIYGRGEYYDKQRLDRDKLIAVANSTLDHLFNPGEWITY